MNLELKKAWLVTDDGIEEGFGLELESLTESFTDKKVDVPLFTKNGKDFIREGAIGNPLICFSEKSAVRKYRYFLEDRMRLAKKGLDEYTDEYKKAESKLVALSPEHA